MARYTRWDEAYDLKDSAYLWRDQARKAGNAEAEELAEFATSSAFNACSAYEAAKCYGGGSSKGWSYRNIGARHLKQARKYLAQVRELLAAGGSVA